MMKDGNNNRNYSIINISSVHEQTPQPESAPYAASKGGMQMLTKTIALELADKEYGSMALHLEPSQLI
jgi:NAD(P)-dependent dehydrogenase (short-subunit alcohol dehydrogenase family)